MESKKKKELIQKIMDQLGRPNPDPLITDFRFNRQKENQLLFFFKPECFNSKKGDDINTSGILHMVLDKLEEFGVTLSGVLLLKGPKLEDLSIMDRHYGYINRLSKNARKLVQGKDREALRKSLGLKSMDHVQVMGGHEFLNEFHHYDHRRLTGLWETKKSNKLRSGFYYQHYTVENEEIVLVNGFHPTQLNHFIDPNHQILVFLLDSNTPWHTLKDGMGGNTYPEKSGEKSIRGELLKNKNKYGLADVSIANNCIHLSAGPYEALFEINNFLKNLESTDYHLTKTNICRLMNKNGTSIDEVRLCLSNPFSQVTDVNTDLYSYTEEKSTEDAISDYINYFRPIHVGGLSYN